MHGYKQIIHSFITLATHYKKIREKAEWKGRLDLQVIIVPPHFRAWHRVPCTLEKPCTYDTVDEALLG